MRADALGDLALGAPFTIAVAAALVVAVVVAVRMAGSRRHGPAGWASTRGTILMTTIQVQRTGNARREVPVVMYAYRVGQQAFQGSTIHADDDPGRSAAGHARHVLDRYPVGASVLVYYDPRNPTRSALER